MTDLFALVCSHDERRHLCVLARLALMFSTDLPAQLRAVEDASAALELVLQTEAEIMRDRG